MMLSGIAYQLPPLALRTAAIVSGLSLTPTPTAGDAKSAANATAGRSEGSEHHSGVTLTDYVRLWPTPNVAGGGNPPDRLKRQGNHFVRPSGKKAHLSLDHKLKVDELKIIRELCVQCAVAAHGFDKLYVPLFPGFDEGGQGGRG
jgi:hypothetical protein